MKNKESVRDQDSDSQWEDLARERLNARLERRSRESLQKNLAEDRPNGVWQKIVRKMSEPEVLGATAAVGFATLMTADVVLNGPSEFVVNSPEAATTAMALGAAAIGAVFGHLGKKASVTDVKNKQQIEHDAFSKEQ